MIALIISIFGIFQTFSAFFYFYGSNISRKFLIFLIWIEYLTYIVLATMIFKLNSLHIGFNLSEFENALTQYYIWYYLVYLFLFIAGNFVMNYFIAAENSRLYCKLKV
jgi:hypothetical protein